MIGKKFIDSKKQEFEIKESIKKYMGKGKINEIKIERTPIGEKIIIITSRPGLVIGSGGSNIKAISNLLKEKFKFENPQIEVSEPENAMFDAIAVAEHIASTLERFGQLSFKLIAYRALDRLIKGGALGAEIKLSGKLPGERSRRWRFAFGYLKKTGEAISIVKKHTSKAFTKPGVVGVKVSIVSPDTKIPDKIEINFDAIKNELKEKISKEKEKILIKVKKTEKSRKIKEDEK